MIYLIIMPFYDISCQNLEYLKFDKKIINYLIIMIFMFIYFLVNYFKYDFCIILTFYFIILN